MICPCCVNTLRPGSPEWQKAMVEAFDRLIARLREAVENLP